MRARTARSPCANRRGSAVSCAAQKFQSRLARAFRCGSKPSSSSISAARSSDADSFSESEEARRMAGTVIGEGLTIEGDISGDDSPGAGLGVAGQVRGAVTPSERVDIKGGGNLVGNTRAARFTIAEGA